MINANELRIGNFIYIDNGEKPKYEYDVTAHDIEEIEGCGDDAFPIPLTEEWLSKFGFENLGFGGITLFYTDHCYFLEYVGLSHIINSALEIEFVHQLQNLYHSLTQQELSITSVNSDKK